MPTPPVIRDVFADASSRDDLIWLSRPAEAWEAGLPIGNGAMGAIVHGGVKADRIALNHELLWRGKHRHREAVGSSAKLAEIRKLFFEGNTLQAGKLANGTLGGFGGMLAREGKKNQVDPFQPVGDLWIQTPHTLDNVVRYQRELDFDTAMASVSYMVGEQRHRYRREIFAHARRPLMALRLTAPDEAPLNVQLGFTRIDDPECTLKAITSQGDDRFGYTGSFPEGISFAVLAQVISPQMERIWGDGLVSPVKDGPACIAAVRGEARELVMLMTIHVSLDGEDAVAEAADVLDHADRTWAANLDVHLEQHRSYWRRSSLTIGNPRRDIPTNERVEDLRRGAEDASLIGLMANYGRYLFITSTGLGQYPPNLQGIWNEQLSPPWESDFHHDVNLQMNHWLAETAGLGELCLPLFRHCERFVPHGREVAKQLYDCGGTYLPLQTDPWGRATPESNGWDVWTGAGAWLAQHFYHRWLYSHDGAFLERHAYPFHKEVAAFYEDYLIEHPKTGELVAVPSQSPENYFEGGTQPVSLCVMATMDTLLVREVLSHAIEMARVLEVDEDKQKQWSDMLDRLPALKVGKQGQLQEWLEDYKEAEPGHRHYSHLYGLYPGDAITMESEPELAKACRTSLELRLKAGGGHTGWSRVWTACLWARLYEGERAATHLAMQMKEFATVSLLDLHPPRIVQLDGNYGFTAGVYEMLLQSHRGVLRLFPAMPWQRWKNGHVAGLHTQMGHTVSLDWADGKPSSAVIVCGRTGACRLTAPELDKARITDEDQSRVQLKRVAENRFVLDAKVGQWFHVEWE